MKEPIWIDTRDAVVVHAFVGFQHGGPPGVRDYGLLESALARPLQIYAYEEGADIVRLAMAYTAGIVSNHPFFDGNKRTGFLVGLLFLEMNGFRFLASEAAATEAVMDLASGKLNEAAYERFLRANVKKPAR